VGHSWDKEYGTLGGAPLANLIIINYLTLYYNPDNITRNYHNVILEIFHTFFFNDRARRGIGNYDP
jgi:hypothetical protein